MPASRIAFAIGDLVSSIQGLRSRDDQPEIAVTLDWQSYCAVLRELAHHTNLGTAHPDTTPAFTFGGMRITGKRPNV